jgi:hypothetical protein
VEADIEYIDEDDDMSKKILSKALSKEIDAKILPLSISDKEKIYKTDTKDYDPTMVVITSPEEIRKQDEAHNKENPNGEFSQALDVIEKRLSRKLTDEEYIAACDSYATILTERDEEKKANFAGKYNINPVKKEVYKEMLLNNKPIENITKQMFESYEKSVIRPIIETYEETLKNEPKVIELKNDARINTHFKGKCRIASDESGKVVIIDNKKDVDLLRMKYRKEWIEKRYPNIKDIEAGIMMREDGEDEFN